MKKIINAFLGILTGFINILIGACGGIVAVEALKHDSLNQTKAHATAIAVILPLTVISAIMYLLRGDVEISDAKIYIIPGVIGSAVGSLILPKVPKNILGKVFSVFIIYAGVRMLIK